jgi:large subunit ribosomal protein L20
MANWSRKKVFKLAKGFKHRSKNVFGVALRKTRRGQ